MYIHTYIFSKVVIFSLQNSCENLHSHQLCTNYVFSHHFIILLHYLTLTLSAKQYKRNQNFIDVLITTFLISNAVEPLDIFIDYIFSFVDLPVVFIAWCFIELFFFLIIFEDLLKHISDNKFFLCYMWWQYFSPIHCFLLVLSMCLILI